MVKQLKNKINRAYLLASGTELKVQREGFATTAIEVPKEAPDPINTVVVIEIEGKPEIPDIQAGQGKSGEYTLKVVPKKTVGAVMNPKSVKLIPAGR